MTVLKDLLGSKKFVTALLTVIGAVAIKLGAPETTVTELTTMLSPFLLYIGGQAVADIGKSREQIAQAARSDPPKMNIVNVASADDIQKAVSNGTSDTAILNVLRRNPQVIKRILDDREQVQP